MKLKGTSEHDDGLLENLEDIVSTAGLEAPIEAASAEVGRPREERVENVKLEALSWQKLTNEHIRAESALAVLRAAVLQG